jgi:hypothetical protein
LELEIENEIRCKRCNSNNIQYYDAIIFCPNCAYKEHPDQYMNKPYFDIVRVNYDNIYGIGSFDKRIKKYKDKEMPTRIEFKLSDEYYFEWSDLSDMVIGNYDKKDGEITKRERIHCTSLEAAIRHIIKMPSINAISLETLDSLERSLSKMTEKYENLISEFEENVVEAMRSRISALEDELILLRGYKEEKTETIQALPRKKLRRLKKD